MERRCDKKKKSRREKRPYVDHVARKAAAAAAALQAGKGPAKAAARRNSAFLRRPHDRFLPAEAAASAHQTPATCEGPAKQPSLPAPTGPCSGRGRRRETANLFTEKEGLRAQGAHVIHIAVLHAAGASRLPKSRGGEGKDSRTMTPKPRAEQRPLGNNPPFGPPSQLYEVANLARGLGRLRSRDFHHHHPPRAASTM